MNRREFIGTALASLFIPVDASATLSPRSRQSESSVSGFLFYDERFPEAERLVKRIGVAGERVPVRGDITHVWNGSLKPLCRQRSLLLAGVTTESFYFCLKTLMYPHAGLDISAQRIDRDLCAWSIRSHHPADHRMMA
jgi:hypothetical protein